MAGFGPQGSNTVIIPTLPTAPAPGNIVPPGDSSWLDANRPNEPQVVTNSSASMASNLSAGNSSVVGQGAGSSTPPNRSQLNTEAVVALHNPAVQGQQGTPALTTAPVYAGVAPNTFSWVKSS
jgi:hypothetical protein